MHLEAPNIPKTVCPTCGSPNDCATVPGKDNHHPKPGDLSVCIGCAEIFVFTPDLSVRAISLAELVALPHLIPPASPAQYPVLKFFS